MQSIGATFSLNKLSETKRFRVVQQQQVQRYTQQHLYEIHRIILTTQTVGELVITACVWQCTAVDMYFLCFYFYLCALRLDIKSSDDVSVQQNNTVTCFSQKPTNQRPLYSTDMLADRT